MTAPSALILQRAIAEVCVQSAVPDVIAFGAALRGGLPLDTFGLAYAAVRFAADNARAHRSKLLGDLAVRYFSAETKRGRPRSILSALTLFHDRQFRAGAPNRHVEHSRPWLLWEICAAQALLPEALPSIRTIREAIGEMVFIHSDGTI